MAVRTRHRRATAAKSRVRKGDTVVIVAGRERGKVGKVLSVSPREDRVTVEKINIVKRHTKPSPKFKQGGIIDREAPMHLSNVMLYAQAVGKPSRVAVKTLEGGRRVRVLQKSPDDVLDNV